MSSRPYAGRHRLAARRLRLPATLSGGFVLPTAAAATLVLTATGATMAETHTGIELTASQAAFSGSAAAQAAEARADDAQASQRRSDAQLEAAAILGREQEQARVARDQARVARDQARVALAKKQAVALLAAAHAWVMPVHGATFTSGFKMRWGTMHTGNDLACPTGTPIYAMSSGVVSFTGWMGGGGNTTKITYWDGTESFYEHQSGISAVVGQRVSPGEVVGYVGNTGHSFGSHLHLEIHPAGGGPIDPHPWMTEHHLDY
ncbi:MAG: M23 family metallopeptidase [Nostocoides sp.]